MVILYMVPKHCHLRPLQWVSDSQEVLKDALFLGLLPVKVVPGMAVQFVGHPFGLIFGHVGVTGGSIGLTRRGQSGTLIEHTEHHS